MISVGAQRDWVSTDSPSTLLFTDSDVVVVGDKGKKIVIHVSLSISGVAITSKPNRRMRANLILAQSLSRAGTSTSEDISLFTLRLVLTACA